MEEQPSTSSGMKRYIPQELQEEIDSIAAKQPRVTANPADLDDNQKRWLIVGICLHSVLSPALRRYVVPILTVLYNELTIKQKIDTQTYPTHLTKYLPTNVYLNYEPVNNNKATYGYQKAKYDYTIKSAVDLSKVFLQTHMAQYTGFDDTCDSSAILGLIINIDKFPPVVKSDAEDVRRNIRNPWAHCDFTAWDVVKYSNSFQLMEKLIKDLSLSFTDENKIIGEMQKWETNGHHFLNGTTLGLELVNDICQQTCVLAEYTKLVANETDNMSMKIKHVLENFDIILNKVTQMEKDMKTGLSDMNKRLLANEEKNNTLLDSQKCEIEFWKEQEDVFVDTPAVKSILKILETEHNVLIVGEPGIGKSMLLHHIALKLQKTIDYDIIPCTGVQDILQQYKEDTRQVFVLDDLCGRFTVSMSVIEHWMINEDKLRRILKKGCTKVTATCRLDIYNDEIFQESCTVFKSNIFNLSVEYSREDKLTICRNYLSKTNIQLLKDQNVNFTPLMCYLYSKNENFNLTDFLECPFETYQTEWNKLKAFDPYKYCSLFLCIIYNGILKESLFGMYNENNTKNRSVLENIFETCGINRGTSRSKIQTVFDSMIGTYVQKTGNKYRVIHDQMFDFLCCYFGNKDEMVKCILRYSDIRVFNQRTILYSIDEQQGKFSILISKKNEKEYFERVKSDVQLGKMNQCFYNTQMKYVVYRTLFLNTLKSMDDKVFSEQINRRPKTRHSIKHGYDSVATMECEYCSYDSDSDNVCGYDDHEETGFPEGPFIKSCLRGYYDIFHYLISKSADIQKYGSIYTPLTAACKGGNEKIVQLLLDKGCNVNLVDGKKQTPLTAACSGGNEKIVQLLIDKGCDIYGMKKTSLKTVCRGNKKEHERQKYGLTKCIIVWSSHTPLQIACKGGNEKIVKLLIDQGIDVNQFDCDYQAPLEIACEGGKDKIAQLLIDNGSDINQNFFSKQTPLTAACKGGSENMVQLLIEKGCEVNQVDDNGKTPLTAACSEGHEEIVRLLIEQGSDVNQNNGKSMTPLTVACSGENDKIVQLLIDKGQNVNHVDGRGQTLLTSACKGGNEKIVQLLIDIGSDVNQVNDMDESPLIAACLKGHENIVHLLIDKGVDVNYVNKMKKTPLTAACKEGNETIVQLLIDKGSDVNPVDMWRTPLNEACMNGNEKIVQLLIDKGSDVNLMNSQKYTPLTWTADWSTNDKIVQLLLDNGSDVNLMDDRKQTPLTEVCAFGNETKVQLLIDKGSDVNYVHGMEKSPLTAACSSGNENKVQLILDKGCDVNCLDGMGQTALTLTCMNGNEKIVKLLLDNGSDVNLMDGLKQTPLTAACSGHRRFQWRVCTGNEKIVQLLLDKGSDINKAGANGRTPLTSSCARGNEQIVQLLLDKGSDVNLVDGMKQTPLTAACSRGNENIVQLLLDKGCDVNCLDGMEQTALTAACVGGNRKIVQLLIDKGCDVNLMVDIKQTPLTTACYEGHKEMVQLLIDEGCQVNKADDNGHTPLLTACYMGHKAIVQLLIEKGSDVNQVFYNGNAPLTIACYEGHDEIVKLLIGNGSEVNKVDGTTKTPLTAACSRGNEKIVQFLIDKDCPVNQVDGNGKTPLITACSRGNKKIVQLLLDKGSNVYHVDDNGQTPMSAACSEGHKEIVQFLIDKGIEVDQVDGTGQTPQTPVCIE